MRTTQKTFFKAHKPGDNFSSQPWLNFSSIHSTRSTTARRNFVAESTKINKSFEGLFQLQCSLALAHTLQTIPLITRLSQSLFNRNGLEVNNEKRRKYENMNSKEKWLHCAHETLFFVLPFVVHISVTLSACHNAISEPEKASEVVYKMRYMCKATTWVSRSSRVSSSSNLIRNASEACSPLRAALCKCLSRKSKHKIVFVVYAISSPRFTSIYIVLSCHVEHSSHKHQRAVNWPTAVNESWRSWWLFA